jgi:ankyrin repeat protein
LESENCLGVTPLLEASRCGFTEIVEFLLLKGANIQHTSLYGSALTRAAAYGFLSTVKLLHSKGADLEGAGTKYKMTAILRATVNGHTEVVKYLADNGANIDACDYNGDSQTISLFLLETNFDKQSILPLTLPCCSSKAILQLYVQRRQ